MRKIVLITRLTGTSLSTFPKVAWINGDRNTIASVEKNMRESVLAAAGIEDAADMEISDLSKAGSNVNVYALLGERTLTAQVATDEQVLAATGVNEANNPLQTELGHVFNANADVADAEPLWLISVAPYTQNVVLKASDTEAGLIDQLSGEDEATALATYTAANKSIANAFGEALQAEELRMQQRAKLAALNQRRAEQKKAAVTGNVPVKPELETAEN